MSGMRTNLWSHSQQMAGPGPGGSCVATIFSPESRLCRGASPQKLTARWTLCSHLPILPAVLPAAAWGICTRGPQLRFLLTWETVQALGYQRRWGSSGKGFSPPWGKGLCALPGHPHGVWFGGLEPCSHLAAGEQGLAPCVQLKTGRLRPGGHRGAPPSASHPKHGPILGTVSFGRSQFPSGCLLLAPVEC